MNFDFIDKCYEVDEQIYDPDVLRDLIERRIKELAIAFERRAFASEMRPDYDFVVWATYGLGPSRGLFKIAKYQVAEKILIELPAHLRGISLVVVDGPFTAFDPYGSSGRSLFGSAKNTNHWTTTDPKQAIPEPYASLAQRPELCADQLQPLRRNAERFRSCRPRVERRRISGIALHDPRGGR